LDIRPVTEDDLEAFYTVFMRNMGFGPPNEAYLEREKKSFLYDRSLAAFDDDEIVGTAHSHLFDVTLPGGASIKAAGVTAISVSPTHRRRGIVTDLKRRQLREARERGEVAGILLASEGRIYRRFGYGIATQVAEVKVVVGDGRVEHRPARGRVRIISGDAIDELVPPLHARVAGQRAGGIVRPKHFWDSAAAERDKKTSHVIHEDASGESDGYAIYDVKADWSDGMPAHKLTVHALIAASDSASAELWTYLLGIDLVREISAYSRPIDEPLRWMLDEPRAVRTQTVRDMYWLRPLDIPSILGLRRYATDVDLTIEVHDPLLDLGGTFHLEGGTDGAVCEPVSGGADLRMDVSELGSIALGGITVSELARAGRIEELTPGAVARATLAFLETPRPWCDVGF
jgi:predicted acetyltransferase